MAGVDLAHAVRVWRGIRGERGTDVGIKARASSAGAHSPSTRVTSGTCSSASDRVCLRFSVLSLIG